MPGQGVKPYIYYDIINRARQRLLDQTKTDSCEDEESADPLSGESGSLSNIDMLCSSDIESTSMKNLEESEKQAEEICPVEATPVRTPFDAIIGCGDYLCLQGQNKTIIRTLKHVDEVSKSDYDTCARVHELSTKSMAVGPPSKILGEKLNKFNVVETRPIVPLNAGNGACFEALIDTGASCSMINNDLYQYWVELSRANPSKVKYPEACKGQFSVKTYSSDNALFVTSHYCKLSFKINGVPFEEVPFLINPKPSRSGTELLLGMNFINGAQVTIKPTDNKRKTGSTLWIPNQSDPTVLEELIECVRERRLTTTASEEVYVAPLDEVRVKLHVDGSLSPGKSSLKNKTFHHCQLPQGLTMSDTDHSVDDDGNIYVTVKNESLTPCTIKQGTHVAEINTIKNEISRASRVVKHLAQMDLSCFCDPASAVQDSKDGINVPIITLNRYGVSDFHIGDMQDNLDLRKYAPEPVQYENGTITIRPNITTEELDPMHLMNEIIRLKADNPNWNALVFTAADRSSIEDNEELTRLIYKLSKIMPVRIGIVSTRAQGKIPCLKCRTIVTHDIKPLIENTIETVVNITSKKSITPFHHRFVDANSKIIGYDYMGSKIYIARSQNKLVTFVHVAEPRRSLEYIRNLVYMIFEHLRRKRVNPKFEIRTDLWAPNDIANASIGLFLVEPFDEFPPLKPYHASPKLEEFTLPIANCRCLGCIEAQRLIDTGKYSPRSAIKQMEIQNMHVMLRGPLAEGLKSHQGVLMSTILEYRRDIELARRKVMINELEGTREDWDQVESAEMYEDLKMPNLLYDPDEMQDCHFKPLKENGWEDGYDVTQLPAHLRKPIADILNKHITCLAIDGYMWRRLNVEPRDIEFIYGEGPFRGPFWNMGEAKNEIWDHKMIHMLNDKHWAIVDENQLKGSGMFYSTSMGFLTWQNSDERIKATTQALENQRQAKRGVPKEERTKIDPQLIKASRLVLNLVLANKHIPRHKSRDHLIRSFDELLFKFNGTMYAAILDLQKAFRHIPISYRTSIGLCIENPFSKLFRGKIFRPLSTPDGMAFSPSFLADIIYDYLIVHMPDNVLAYADDLVITGATEEHMLRNLDEALGRLDKIGAVFNVKKMKLMVPQFEFLGRWITLTGDTPIIGIQPERKAHLLKIQQPSTKKQLQSFLGAVNWIGRHIPGFQMVAKPLTDSLTNTNFPFKLNDSAKKAVKQIQHLIEKHLVGLHGVDPLMDLHLAVDSSLFGHGAMFFQVDNENRLKIIRMTSKKWPDKVICEKTSPIREVYAIHEAIAANKDLVNTDMCTRLHIYSDLSAVIELLKPKAVPEYYSGTIANIASKLHSLPVEWRLKSLKNTSYIIQWADIMSRAFPQTYVGLPLHVCNDINNFFKGYHEELKRKYEENPQYQVTMDQLIDDVKERIEKDPKMSDAVKKKRLDGLQKSVEEEEKRSYVFFGQDAPKPESPIASITVISATQFPSPTLAMINKNMLEILQSRNKKLMSIKNRLIMVDQKFWPKEIKENFRLLNNMLVITKKKLKDPWEDFGNMRVVMPFPISLELMAILHISMNHPGQNSLVTVFNRSFKTQFSNAQAKVLLYACKSCCLSTVNTAKRVKTGRIPKPNGPNKQWALDIAFLTPGTYQQQKPCSPVLVMVDIYSSFIWIRPLRNETASEIKSALIEANSIFDFAGKDFITDNASVFHSEEFQDVLKMIGVANHTTIAPYNSQGNLAERAIKFLRTAHFHNKVLWKGLKKFDALYLAVSALNNRLMANLKEPARKNDALLPTPRSLMFGGIPDTQIFDKIVYESDEKEIEKYNIKLKELVEKFERDTTEELEKRIREEKTSPLKVGDLVMWKYAVSKKDRCRNHPDIYEVDRIGNRKALIISIFYGKKRSVDLNLLRKFKPSSLIQSLPDHLKEIYGACHTREELFEGNNPFQDVRITEIQENLSPRNWIDRYRHPSMEYCAESCIWKGIPPFDTIDNHTDEVRKTNLSNPKTIETRAITENDQFEDDQIICGSLPSEKDYDIVSDKQKMTKVERSVKYFSDHMQSQILDLPKGKDARKKQTAENRTTKENDSKMQRNKKKRDNQARMLHQFDDDYFSSPRNRRPRRKRKQKRDENFVYEIKSENR